MADNFLTVAQNVLTLFILIGVGAACGKWKLLNDEAVKACANLALYVATPCVIVHSCIREFDMSMLWDFLLVALVAVLNHLALILIARLVFREKEEERRRVFRFATVFANAGFMALPLQQAVLGETGVFYCAAYIMVFNTIMWTYGVFEIGGDQVKLSPKSLINPGTIGVVLGLLIFLLSVPVPTMLADAVRHLGNLNTPVPMLVVGYYLGQTDLRAALGDKRSYVCLALRLVIMPVMAMAALLLCGVRGDVLTSCMICISTPVATATTMMATRYDRDPLLSVNLVSVSTLLSMVTMPVLISLTDWLGSIL